MKSILIIDGSVTYAGLFEARGWAVITCTNPDIAMNRIADGQPYNVVLINYLIGDALKLVRFMRLLDHRQTTAIVMIARDATEAEEGRWAGADRALVSPVNSHSLIYVVEEQAR